LLFYAVHNDGDGDGDVVRIMFWLLLSSSCVCCMHPSVGEPFDTFYIGFAFPHDAPDALVTNVSASVLQLQVRPVSVTQSMIHPAAMTVMTVTHQRSAVPVIITMLLPSFLWQGRQKLIGLH
jgi:hypothetical protein